MKALSRIGFLLMAGGAVAMIFTHSLFSVNPIVIGVQVAAFALMIWARLTFGGRSFHATADPTEGGVVTTGPYAFVRHPIYTAVFLFCLAGGLGNLPKPTTAFVLLVLAGAFLRMIPEERLLVERYSEYAEYAKRTKRMIPFIL